MSSRRDVILIEGAYKEEGEGVQGGIRAMMKMRRAWEAEEG